MHRTHKRPLPQGTIHVKHAGWFASLLLATGGLILWQHTNPLTTYLTVGAMLGYAFLYTAILKHLTPQNIVIGGLFGALPPLLGWTAITNQVDALPLLLDISFMSFAYRLNSSSMPYTWLLIIYAVPGHTVPTEEKNGEGDPDLLVLWKRLWFAPLF